MSGSVSSHGSTGPTIPASTSNSQLLSIPTGLSTSPSTNAAAGMLTLSTSPGARSYMSRTSSNDDDLTCPYTLPDVSREHNPVYTEIDDDALYTDLHERVSYLTQFVNFTEHDVEALNDFQPILLPMVDQLVDNVYHQLFRFDVTKRVFMPRKEGQEGRMLSDLHDLSLDAPQIQMRKKTFAVYMRKLVTVDYDDFSTWQYFDHIGIMHTGQNELKHRKLMGKAPLYVDLIHLSLLLAWTLDTLTPIILTSPYPLKRRMDILRAFQKVIWIQNDLFTRHYAVRSTEVFGLNALRGNVDLRSVEGGSREGTPTTSFGTIHTNGSGSSGTPSPVKESMGPLPSPLQNGFSHSNGYGSKQPPPGCPAHSNTNLSTTSRTNLSTSSRTNGGYANGSTTSRSNANANASGYSSYASSMHSHSGYKSNSGAGQPQGYYTGSHEPSLPSVNGHGDGVMHTAESQARRKKSGAWFGLSKK